MREFDTPEKNMEHFFKRMQEPSWTWGTPNVLPLPKCSNKEKFEPNCMKCKIIIRCFLRWYQGIKKNSSNNI